VIKNRARDAKYSNGMEVEGTVQLLFEDVFERIAPVLFGGVVQQHIQLAVLSHGTLHNFLAEGRDFQIAGQQQAVTDFGL